MICIANIYSQIIVKLFYVKALSCVFLDHDMLVSTMSFITKLDEAEVLTRSYRYFIIHMPSLKYTVNSKQLTAKCLHSGESEVSRYCRTFCKVIN